MALTPKKVGQALDDAGGVIAVAARALGVPRETLRDYARRNGLLGAGQENLDPIDPVTEHRLAMENRQLKAQLRRTVEEVATDRALDDLARSVCAKKLNPPKWLAPKRSTSTDHAIATAFLSDTHFDEVVRPEQINWVNAYGREIAEIRLRNFFSNVYRLATEFVGGIKLDGLVLALGGDMLSGNIHEELKETNEAPINEGLLHWSEMIVAGIRLLLELGLPIHIPAVVGNHGRNSRKPRSKFRAQENFDWLLYHIVAREFRAEIMDGSVTFDIADGADTKFQIYSTRYQLTHGDQFRGGSGIAGLLSPLMLGDHRKRKRESAMGQPYDYMVLGHWHQLAFFRGLIVNGSLKGYDEYASDNNFDFEPPQQAFWLTDPRWGKTVHVPVHVLGEDENWNAQPGYQLGAGKVG